MATKRTKKHTAAKKNPVDQAQAMWLAGLGAVSLAQKRSGALFTALTSEGEDFQTRTQQLAQTLRSDAQKQVKGVVGPIKTNARKALQTFAAAVQHGIASALATLGIPSKSDIAELTTRVTALSRQLKTR